MRGDDQQQRRNIVIVGGGIIGCTSAYFITRHPSYNAAIHSITILEATAIASGASGKAGGLLALWAYPSSIVPLSYRLHEELAAEHNGTERWGYRKIHSGSLSAKVRARASTTQNGSSSNFVKEERPISVPKDLDWLDPELITAYSEMGDPSTTAQVHPYQFTTSMASLAQERGVRTILGSVKAVNYPSNKIQSVTYFDKASQETHTITDVTDVIISAGPWTSEIFPEAPIDALRAHSVTIEAAVSPYALFTEIDLPLNFGSADESTKKSYKRHGKTVSPEIYARPNNEVYACGEGDSLIPLPSSTDLVQVDESRCQDVIDYVSAISPTLAKGEILVKQACYLPSLRGGGGPLIGKTGIEGVLLATGHTCWGIQNSCATGKLISEFLYDGRAKSASVEELDPRTVIGKV